jgi:hypothetical protein
MPCGIWAPVAPRASKCGIHCCAFPVGEIASDLVLGLDWLGTGVEHASQFPEIALQILIMLRDKMLVVFSFLRPSSWAVNVDIRLGG